MPRCLSFALVLLTTLVTAHAQPPGTAWTRSYGGPRLDRLWGLCATSDSGYIATGDSYSDSAGSEIWALRTDGEGELLWSRTLGGPDTDRGRGVVMLPDGRYLIAGSSIRDTTRWTDGVLLCLNPTGDSLWCRYYGGPDDDWFQSIGLLADGSLMITGTTYSFGSGGGDAWLLRTNTAGEILWEQALGGSGWDYAATACQTPDGDLVLAGNTASFGAGGLDVWLVKVSLEGDSLWSRTFGGSSLEGATDLAVLPNGDLVVTGYTESFGQGFDNIYVVRTDGLGQLVWSRTFGNASACGKAVLALPDGGVVVGGWLQRTDDDTRFYLVRLDAAGDSLWGQEWGDGWTNMIEAIVRNADGGFTYAGVTGWDYQHGIETGQGVLIRTAPELATDNERPTLLPERLTLYAFPNPFNSATTLRFSLPVPADVTLTLYDVLGRVATTRDLGRIAAGEHAESVDAAGMASGIYFVNLRAGSRSMVKKIALVR